MIYFTATNLRVNYRKNSLGIDESSRFIMSKNFIYRGVVNEIFTQS
jgi:hypothetical protein